MMYPSIILSIFYGVLSYCCHPCLSKILDFEFDLHGIPEKKENTYNEAVLLHNTRALSKALQGQNNTFIHIPSNKTFHLTHGVFANYIQNTTLQIDGRIKFHRLRDDIPVDEYNIPLPCILIEDSDNVTFTSASANDLQLDHHVSGKEKKSRAETYGDVSRGVLDGGGPEWWGIPGIGYVELIEFRPNLLVTNRTTNILIEYLIIRDPPLWTLNLIDVNHLTMRYSSIIARRTHDDGHNLLDLSAFNSDGIDVSGHNVHVYDVDIWNQDDCIAVKDSFTDGLSTNMTFERITASGLGLTVGSIGGTHVKNITFRDSFLYRTYKGIYMKFRYEEDEVGDVRRGLIEDVLFENITMETPLQWGIWIGPAQQAISANPCHASPCSLCWPLIPFAICDGTKHSQYKNITLKDIQIRNPKGSPGVILADESNPIDGIIFDNVIVMKDVVPLPRPETFYGLRESIDDKFVTPPYLIGLGMFGFIVAVILAQPTKWCIQCICFKTTTTTTKSMDASTTTTTTGSGAGRGGGDPENRPLIGGNKQNEKTTGNNMSSCTSSLNVGGIIIVTVAIAAFLQRTMEISRKTHDVDQYFVCRGVVNGVAIGDSWPVPDCFEDRTN